VTNFTFNIILELIPHVIFVNSIVFLYFSVLTFGLITNAYTKIDLRPGKLPFKVWLHKNELWRYTRFISLLFDNKYLVPKGQWRELYALVPKIIEMWKLSGITFTIKYWGEVLRLVVCYVDPHNVTKYDTKTWVSRHKRKGPLQGLPTVLTNKLKQLCVETKEGILRGSLPRITLLKFKLLLTLLAFIRATSPKFAEIKTSTITGSFTGTSETLSVSEVSKALKSLGILGNFHVGKPNMFHFSMKAGPNAPLAVLGIGFDLLGWMCRPNKWLEYCLMCWSRGYFQCLTIFVLSSLLLVPLLPIVIWWDAIPLLGRIAVLEEARGKRRLIGITDWWTQVLLKPLHTAIYRFLDSLESDGTRDQQKVVQVFLRKLNVKCLVGLKGKRCQSMDLSAATDRLPVKLQAQILELLGFPGNLWMSILDRDWLLLGERVRYAVGQPMGAYSSFAMLALTHHVIVHIAASRSGIHPKSLIYMVLGDDGAMANSKVAKSYMEVFSELGLEINPLKGFSGTVLEFAKQLWTINGIKISPIGAKNIMLALRHVEFLPSVLYELWVKRFPLFKNFKKSVPKTESAEDWTSSLMSKYVVSRGYRSTDPELLRGHSTSSLMDRYTIGKPIAPAGDSKWFTVEPIEEPKVKKSVFKRTEEGAHQVCMISALSLFKLISAVHFQSGKKGKVIKFNLMTEEQKKESLDITTKITLRVLMAIGPISGLWYPSPYLVNCYRGSGIYNLYRNLFLQGIYSWFYKYDKNYNFKSFCTYLLELIKTTRQGRVSIIKNAGNAFRDLRLWSYNSIMLPLTFIVDFSRESSRIPPIHNLLTPFTLLGFPILVLLNEGLKAFGKVLSQSWAMFKFYFLRSLLYYNSSGREVLVLLFLGTLGLTWDFWFCFHLWALPFALHWVLTSKWCNTMLRSRIYFSPIYGFPGVNVIEDKTSRIYDPFDSSISTLVKVSSDVKLEDSGAWLNIISLLKRKTRVKQLLERQKSSVKAPSPKGNRKTSDPRFRLIKDYSSV
jgi:hypothetical protein